MPRKITQRQLIANKANGKLGGVKTIEGKTKVKFNARKHGILAIFVSKYEAGIHQEYLEELFDEYKPKSFLEEILAERIAIHYLQLYRIGKAENEIMNKILKPQIYNFEDISTELIKEEGYKAIMVEKNIQTLHEIYCRYETSIENKLYKAIHELDRIQRQRKGEYVMPTVTLDVNQNGFVSQNR